MSDITALELKARIEKGESFTLIDVREPHEHEEFNIGGQNLPLGEIMEWSEHLHDQGTEIILYCRSGNRSAMARSFLMSKGFQSVSHLAGGIIAWQKL